MIPMRVLLINPFYPISETPSPPLGLAYLAAALQEANIDVRVLDLVVYPYSESDLARLLDGFKPGLVGLTAVTMNIDRAFAVAEVVKRLAPEILTVMGGPHVTFSARESLAACPALDAAVLGEGEQTLVELCRAVERGQRLDSVKGLVFRSEQGVCFTGRRGFIRNLDRLPMPARHLLPLGRYRALGMPISMTTSRGCPHACIFCVGRRMVGARVRYRSPGLVVDELEHLAGLGFHQVNLADDLFTADHLHCSAVCDEILKRGLRTRWTSFARVDTVSEGLLHRMQAAGCTAVSFGIESANPEILKTIKKRITVDQVVSAVGMCANAGVTPFASFILGLPGETPDTLRETIEFGKRLEDKGLVYGFHILAPFPGTEVRERAAELGLRILTTDWSAYHANRAVAETETVSRRMLDEIAVEWEDRFNRYLADIKDRMQRGLASAEETYQLTNLERIVCVYDLMMKRTIEKVGSWPADKGPAAEVDRLIERVQPAADAITAVLRDALENAVLRGHLIAENGHGRIRWRWRDYL
jgi:anaerobic magnesium-protoporphyrin IX monomethyl ester cyclase